MADAEEKNIGGAGELEVWYRKIALAAQFSAIAGLSSSQAMFAKQLYQLLSLPFVEVHSKT